jgi:hypothetical protein
VQPRREDANQGLMLAAQAILREVRTKDRTEKTAMMESSKCDENGRIVKSYLQFQKIIKHLVGRKSKNENLRKCFGQHRNFVCDFQISPCYEAPAKIILKNDARSKLKLETHQKVA